MTVKFLKKEVDYLVQWITLREDIRRRREAGQPPPWTTDKVMQKWRFCNVRRVHDRTTIWIHRRIKLLPSFRWRAFNCLVARRINRIETLYNIGFPFDDWTAKTAKQVQRYLDVCTINGGRAFNAAYDCGMPGSAYARLVPEVLTPWVDIFDLVEPTMEATWRNIVAKVPHTGEFIGGQIVLDMAETEFRFNDYATWAALGPGSSLALDLLTGRIPSATYKRGKAIRNERSLGSLDRAMLEMETLMACIRPRLPGSVIDMPLYDLEHCLCEYFKWRRGNGKQRYKPHAGDAEHGREGLPGLRRQRQRRKAGADMGAVQR